MSADAFGAGMCHGCWEESPFDVVPSLIESDDADQIAAVIQHSEGKVFINASRGAIQGIGCGGDVRYHMTLSPRLLDAIATRLASSP
jgi:hypothetical protein